MDEISLVIWNWIIAETGLEQVWLWDAFECLRRNEETLLIWIKNFKAHLEARVKVVLKWHRLTRETCRCRIRRSGNLKVHQTAQWFVRGEAPLAAASRLKQLRAERGRRIKWSEENKTEMLRNKFCKSSFITLSNVSTYNSFTRFIWFRKISAQDDDSDKS